MQPACQSYSVKTEEVGLVTLYSEQEYYKIIIIVQRITVFKISMRRLSNFVPSPNSSWQNVSRKRQKFLIMTA